MKRVLVLFAVAGVAVYATTAWSAAGPTPTEKQLLKDVATLKSQVKKLQAQMKAANTNINTAGSLGATALLYTVCSDTLTADALQGTWQIVDQVATTAGQAARFGPQTPVTATLQGQDVCAAGNVSRSQVLPPTVAGYEALLSGFHTDSVLRAYMLAHHK
jgi:outer membrane murein-binding lipoprotein Lpp